MEHLFNSRCLVLRLRRSMRSGRAYNAYEPISQVAVAVRLDLQFIRPGKDAPPPVEAGKAADRFGIGFASFDAGLKAGDYLQCVPNDMGQLPVSGTFEIKEIPDAPQDYSTGHHLEFQVQEVAAPGRAAEMAGEEPE